jgi:hypothetical protein
MSNEWVIKVTADVKGVLDASRQIGQAGKAAGQEFQSGFAANDKLLERLRNQLKELSQGTSSNATTLGSLKAKLGADIRYDLSIATRRAEDAARDVGEPALMQVGHHEHAVVPKNPYQGLAWSRAGQYARLIRDLIAQG